VRFALTAGPSRDEWTVIFSKNSTSWGSFTYSQAEDALRVKVKPKTAAFREELTYEFVELTEDAATILMSWESVAVPVHLQVDTKTLTLDSLRRELRHLPGYKAEAWYEAALFCVDRQFNYDEALKWIDRAIAEGEENFDNLDLKAQILAGLGRTQDAGTVQAKALAVATPEQMYAYGDRLLREKKIADAEGVFSSVTQKHPGSWLPWYGLARVQVAKGDRAAAERSLQSALKAATASGAKQGIAGMKRMLERLAAGQGIG
jgi:predicted Zn-dependent protease